MPLITVLFLAIAGGLWLSIVGVPWLAAGLGVLLGGWGIARRRPALGIAALALGFGSLVGGDVARRDRACRRAILRGDHVVVRLLQPLGRGRSASALAGTGCRVRILVSSRVAVAAGSLVEVRGVFRRMGDGLAVRASQVERREGPSWMVRQRTRVGQWIDGQFREDGPLVRALVLADQGDLAPELRRRWSDAGIIHMVSVSGLHVSIIAGALVAMASASGLRRGPGDLAATLLLAGYVAFIGAPAPAVRSAIMSTMPMASRALQRSTSPWAIWAVGSGVSLVEPRTVIDLGWQLSVIGMAGLMASARFTAVARRMPTWARGPAEGAIATALATVVSAPIIGWTFGRLSVAAVATNVLAAPMFAVAQPLLFATVALGWLPDAVVGFLVDASRGALGLVDLVASAGARVPFAAIPVAPDMATAVALAVVALGFVLAGALRTPRAGMRVALLGAVLALWTPVMPRGNGRLELHVIDVGQGDALALRSPAGRWLLVDAGPSWDGGDAGARVVAPWVRRRGGDVVHQVVTHPHLDHFGGVSGLLPTMALDTLWDAGGEAGAPYHALLDSARHRGVVVRTLVAGDSILLDGVVVRVLAPGASWRDRQANPNESSVVLLVEWRRQRWLLMGDAEAGLEGELLRVRREALRASVLKVGHHGSSTSSTPAFLAAVRPRVALVSVGRDNDYGHPSPDVLRRFDASGVHVLRTDDEGSIILSTDGELIDVQTEATRWRYSTGSRAP